ncbi:transcription factor TGA4-like [Amaranthus tricolor]|uniref:transcription factor TGA4-like n=1 Tax=Amaranthus tricolor TaxID=29722 RepID=UPI002582F071|nr:transcription factor TGA4-like [Amaranthus tricolor]XP_057541369.1 transcription factor TGA4-like [Amaranthus tricolor]XP_057541370.1 transcription factor TGA4-like [Amaranthus tricolor]XP_057541371.1 transcription factor TGA4-like [Amaranthus tricolor]
MNSTSTQFVISRRMNMYEHQINSWVDSFRDDAFPNVSPSTVVEVHERVDNLSEDTSSHGAQAPPNKYDQEASKPIDKIQRRLAQNREAARKSRLRKKAYIQQLELGRSKLMQMEQELERVRQQGVYVGGGIDQLPFSPTVNSGIVAFEMEYAHWVEEQNKQICELRNALNAHITDVELRILVDIGMKHYFDLFQLKGSAAKADVFYLISGMWKTSTERFFLWIGGFRPSELLKVLGPQLDPLTEQQVMGVYNLKQSCEQAEEALTQGMEKLQQTLAETIATDHLGDGIYTSEMANNAIERLEALVSFVNQADHLRKETLQQIHRILTIRQAARGLLALGEYFQRLRALSSLWCSRPPQPA